MKPLTLTIKAFGSFAEQETIDFSILKNRSLFLIHGSTGSGKTTILDAICFALYGESSGRDRDAYLMRSDFSDDTLQTEITLTFNLGADYFKVLRIPEQQRDKVRGSGKTKKVATATLWKYDPQVPDSEGTIIADRWSRVTEKIESLLGFRSDQFRQVVILPQGDFRRLLSANSQERQEILTILFKTGRFKLFEDAFKETARNIKNQFDTFNSQLQFYYKECSINSLDELSEILHSTESETNELNDKCIIARTQEKAILESLTEAKEINARFIELQNASQSLQILIGQKTDFDQQSTQVEFSEKALALYDQWEYYTQQEKEYGTAKEKRIQYEQYSFESKKTKSLTEQLLTEIQQKNAYRELRAANLEHLRLIEPKLKQLEQCRLSINTFRQKIEQLTQTKNKKKEHIDKIRAALERLQIEHSTIRESSCFLESRRKNVSEIEATINSVVRLNSLQKQFQTLSTDIETARNEYNLLLAEIEKSKMTLDNYDRLRQEFQSASLAKNLTDGLPCPVCGSRSHPSPAVSNQQIPTDKEFQSLKSTIKRLEIEKENYRNKIEQHQINFANIEKEISLINDSLANQENRDLSTLKVRLFEYQTLVNESLSAAGKIEKLSSDITRGTAALTNAEKEFTTIQDTLSNTVADLRSQEVLLKSLESEIPSEYCGITSISKQIEDIEKEIRDFDKLVEKSKTDFDSANEKYIISLTTLEKLRESEDELNAKVTTSKERFFFNIKESGFNSLDHFKASLISKSVLLNKKSSIQSFYLTLHATEERLQRASDHCKGLSEPDLSLYEQKHNQVQSEIDLLIKQINTLNQKRDFLLIKKVAIQEILKEILALEDQFGIAGRLHEVASGDNPLRMTFERFILASLLDEVLYAGSRRLSIMSSGRFELQRARTTGDLRTSGGLDLQIFDSYTGTYRPVSSLSGGESFLAALSLALGLADIVQSHAGGVKIETIFIDEGFGSLDAEALDLVFQALSDLGQGGRLVGIISHVSELRERIDTRLEVIAGKKGSYTRFKI